MNYIIVSNGKWRRWIFEPSDYARALRFAWKFDLAIERVKEIPFSAGYTVWVGKEDSEYNAPVKGFVQMKYDMTQMFV